MVKLTIMYNVPEGVDHEAFIRWRTNEHQEDKISLPGAIKSDFYVIKKAWTDDKVPSYSYMTEAYFPDMETLQCTFFDPDCQKELAESLKLVADPVFFFSEEVLSEVTQTN